VDLESQLRIEHDQAAAESLLAERRGYLVRREGDSAGLYWAALQPDPAGTTPFVARIQWFVYPDQPPSVLFADAVGGKTSTVSAWPAANGYRAPNDICKPFTAEGHALHADWAAGHHRWRTEGNPFLFIIETMLDDINRNAGRRAS
jgi:hypothetical protein